MRRDWRDARDKVQREGRCRNCGATDRIEAAHVSGRRHDRATPLHDLASGLLRADSPLPFLIPRESGKALYVDPVDVIPLCGPATDSRTCHGQYDTGRLDVLPLLTVPEQVAAVIRLGGIEAARRRVCGE